MEDSNLVLFLSILNAECSTSSQYGFTGFQEILTDPVLSHIDP